MFKTGWYELDRYYTKGTKLFSSLSHLLLLCFFLCFKAWLSIPYFMFKHYIGLSGFSYFVLLLVRLKRFIRKNVRKINKLCLVSYKIKNVYMWQKLCNSTKNEGNTNVAVQPLERRIQNPVKHLRWSFWKPFPIFALTSILDVWDWLLHASLHHDNEKITSLL